MEINSRKRYNKHMELYVYKLKTINDGCNGCFYKDMESEICEHDGFMGECSYDQRPDNNCVIFKKSNRRYNKERYKQYYQENKDEIKKRVKKYCIDNREKIREKARIKKLKENNSQYFF